MPSTRLLLTASFCAGVLGALGNSLVAWLFGHWGLPELLEVSLAPRLNSDWLYPRLVWGGLWGLVYFFTVGAYNTRRHWVRKGLWVSLLPTAFQLFVVFPYWTAHGMFGFALGKLTPAFVVFYNLVWGFGTGVFTRIFWGSRR